MITKGVKALVIASIDDESLTAVLEKSHEAGIPVIAYDRLVVRNSPYADYYFSFSHLSHISSYSSNASKFRSLSLDSLRTIQEREKLIAKYTRAMKQYNTKI